MINFERLDFPIKIWVDQGKAFKGEFAKFCASNAIHVYHTFSETKSCMAERYTRSVKTLIYKYFEEFQTFRYIQHLQKFEALVNRRWNRAIKMAAEDVTADHVPYLLALQSKRSFSGSSRRPKFKVGDSVRIAFKDMLFRKS